MGLFEAIRVQCLCPRTKCADKEDILRRAASLAKECDILRDIPTERIYQGFADREKLSSTAIGDGIALPHCRIPGVPNFVAGMITLAEPVEFGTADGKKVNIVAFIVGPDSDTTEHPRILSGLSLRLAGKDDRKKLLEATTSQELYKLLAPPEEAQQPIEAADNAKRLMQVIVQDEDTFHRILETIESVDGTVAVVLEGSNAGQFLVRRPVFAGFLTDSPNEFCKLILSTVPKNLTNETIRRIEAVTGSLDERNDVAVIVQDVFLMTGMLGI